MSDVFISYARSTEAQARQIGEGLRALGYRVWRDDEIPAHRKYADVIEEWLNTAKAGGGLVHRCGRASEWVRSEAETRGPTASLCRSTSMAELPMPFDQTLVRRNDRLGRG